MQKFMADLPEWYGQMIGAVFIMLCASAITWGFGLSNPLGCGAAFSIGFYYGREVTQYQSGLAIKLRVPRRTLWHRGWFLFEWGSITKVMQLIIPAVACVLLAALFSL
jgi:hypothetical protein